MRTRVLLACAVAALSIQTASAAAHEGNPNFRSEITGFDPALEGVSAEVLNFDDSVRLANESGEEVLVRGYEDEPYVRISAEGTVEVNTRSPAYFLNDDRFAEVDVPTSADPEAPPAWKEVDETGQYSWHDHRAHYMAEGTPPQVKDEAEETKVFDYEIPIEVGGEPAAIEGTLTWVGEDGGFPLLPFAALGVAALALVGLLVARRRHVGDGPGREDRDAGEAW
jgi:hypothetical protein